MNQIKLIYYTGRLEKKTQKHFEEQMNRHYRFLPSYYVSHVFSEYHHVNQENIALPVIQKKNQIKLN